MQLESPGSNAKKSQLMVARLVSTLAFLYHQCDVARLKLGFELRPAVGVRGHPGVPHWRFGLQCAMAGHRPATSRRQGDFHQHEGAAGMDQRCDVFRGDECVIRGASLQQAAKLLNIDMFELAVTILKYERCKVGEFSVVPSADAQDASDHG